MSNPRFCKYGCQTELIWDDSIKKFKETASKEIHTQERCKSIKDKKNNTDAVIPGTGTFTQKPIVSNDRILEEMQDYHRDVVRLMQYMEAIMIKLGLTQKASEVPKTADEVGNED